MNMALWKKIESYFSTMDIDGAIQYLEEELGKFDKEVFSAVPGLRFLNSTSEILKVLNTFIEDHQKQFSVESVYGEMNGFDINYDRWFFNFFAFDSYSSDNDDLDWLSDWQSEDCPEITLVGMEHVQEIYSWRHENEIWKSKPHLDEAFEILDMLVICRFEELIGNSVKEGCLVKPIPVLATAHDYDLICRFLPE